MKKIIFNLLIVTAFAVTVQIGVGVAFEGPPPGLKASLSIVDQNDNPVPKDVFVLDQDVIRMAVYMQYVGQDSLIASEIFARKRFHLCLLFTYVGPDGKEKLITADNREDAGDPPPPRVKLVGSQLLQMELVEVFPSGWVWKVAFDVKDHYTLPGAGSYSVESVIPITAYQGSALQVIDDKKYAKITDANWVDPVESSSISFSIVTDADDDGYCFPVAHESCQYAQADCNDQDPDVNPGATEIEGNGIDDDCNPETADVPDIPPGYILVEVDKHIVGIGNHPGSTKEGLDGVAVKAFDKTSDSCCMQYFGVSWHYYESIWLSSVSPESECCKELAAGVTGDPDSGEVTLEVPPGEYLVIGKYEEGEQPIYMGVSVGQVESGLTKKKYLQLIEKASGKKSPGKTSKKRGSELLIIEPEYVEWDGTQELYPVIFESIGDWSVTTSVDPPEGFVADHDSLAEDVNTELEAVQFTLTDVGSTWKETKVKHKIKHKGKKETVNSKIDVMLSKKLAKKKKKSRYGDGFNPWKKKKKDKK